ncbi:MAG TPA: TrbG/VirB9 family P-type conjugative transfer protein [Novosphingobium sp.]|nr:TrbG/VirB9 family P-type conjugative transfer protein [Novosphingobium sp.]
MKRALALMLMFATPTGAAAAQMIESDARVATVAYAAGSVVPLRTAAGNSLAIIFAPGERILGVEVGDPEAIEVALSGTTDSLVVRTLRAPANPALTVRTNLRQYSFDVKVGPANEAAYTVRFTYGPETPTTRPAPTTAGAMVGSYKLSGTLVLRPARISDDGVHTYLEWSEEQALPAVFALNSLGEEEMVDGYMRDGIFTIDRINPVLVFRIGKKTAKAERLRN